MEADLPKADFNAAAIGLHDPALSNSPYAV
jgi:hypothetical protein